MNDQEKTADGAAEATSANDNEVQAWNAATGQSADPVPTEDSDTTTEDAAAPDEDDEPADAASSEEPEGDDRPAAEKQRTPDPDDAATREKRLRGAISARDRQINELKAKIASFGSDDGDDENDDDDDGGPETLAALIEEYPELLGPVFKRLDRFEKRLGDFGEQVDTVSQLQGAELDRYIDQQEAFLHEEMPDWQDMVSEDNAPKFWRWVDDQNRADRELALSSQDGVQDGEAMLDLLTRFKTHLSGEEPPAKQDASASHRKSGADSRRMDGARTVPQRGSQAATSQPRPDETDAVAIWRKVTAK